MAATLAEKLVALGMTPELAKTLADAGVLTDNAVTLAGAQEITGAKTFTAPVTIGADDTGHDFIAHGATAGKKLHWDESADTLIVAGAITGPTGLTSSVANLVAGFVPTAVQQAINANGAINLTSYNTAVTSVATTGQAFTLAAGAVIGHRKRIQLIVDDGDATVTFNTNATLVYDAVGDTAELIWTGAAWIPIALYNCADGATGPVYTPAS